MVRLPPSPSLPPIPGEGHVTGQAKRVALRQAQGDGLSETDTLRQAQGDGIIYAATMKQLAVPAGLTEAASQW